MKFYETQIQFSRQPFAFLPCDPKIAGIEDELHTNKKTNENFSVLISGNEIEIKLASKKKKN